MNPTVTTEELLALTKSADLLRQTAEKAMRFDEAERLLTEHIRSWERLQNAVPANDKPLVDRVLGYIGDLQRRRRNWEKTAERNSRNEDFYRGLLDAVAVHLGKEAYTADDGGLHDSPIRLKIPALVARIVRENETLARNMPPEPPAEEPDKRPGIVQVMDYSTAFNPDQFNATQPTGFTKVLGQQWCKTDRAMTDLVNFAFKFDMQTHYIVLCEVHQDVQTGALTYRPLSVEDLPLVP